MSNVQNMWDQFYSHIKREQYEQALTLLHVIEKYLELKED
jgi:hypothetical protein